MFESAKKMWRTLRRSRAGERFAACYASRRSGDHSALARMAWLAGGAVMTAIGLVMMPAPGPGIPIVAVGIAMVAAESRTVARGLDRLELRVRGWLGR